MTIYVISYDLSKPNRDYNGLYDAIKGVSGTWWHYLESTWLIKTDKTVTEILNFIRPHIDNDDNLLIIEAGKKHNGWLNKDAWNWIKRNEK